MKIARLIREDVRSGASFLWVPVDENGSEAGPRSHRFFNYTECENAMRAAGYQRV